MANQFETNRTVAPPRPEKKPVTITQHGVSRVDNYAWLRDENWQEVLRDPAGLSPDIRAALDAENTYYEAATENLSPLRERLIAEMRGRIKENDASVPAPDGPFLYWTRFRDGGEYPVFMRSELDSSNETVLFDGDGEGKGEKFFDIGTIAHSPDHKLIACAIDRVGSEYFTITLRDTASGKDLDDVITSADGGSLEWDALSTGFFYVERDDNQRPNRVRYHKIGQRQEDDRLVYHETDDGFFVSLDKSQSGDFVFIVIGNQVTSEARFIAASAPEGEATLIAPREHNIEYYVDHHGDDFLIQTNVDGAVDFKIAKAPVASPGRDQWQDFIAHKAGVYLSSFTPYRDFHVRLVREDAKPRLIISDYSGDEFEIGFDEPAYSLSYSSGYEFATDQIRFAYSSPSTPDSQFSFDVQSRERTLLKVKDVPSGHDQSLYVVERINAIADDGAEIPVVILRLRTTALDGQAPAMLYGYGSYGANIPDSFNANVLSLVDRGMVYASAHIRGGSSKGRQWYLDGKLAKKMNTFTDFNRAAEALIEHGYSATGRIVSYGGSAGGLLVGASVNLRPDLYAGVIAAVPFVDVINTISDADLPLTPPEWDEWGNPITSAEHYRWIAAYSPYDNIGDASYPPILATAGLTDYRVTYWEPAKWVARLRDNEESRQSDGEAGGPFFLRINMGAGHGGSAARFERLEERAHLFAFALKVLGREEAVPVSHAAKN